jgi:hypothetical protein
LEACIRLACIPLYLDEEGGASQQLRILKLAKIVITEQSGYYTYYSINYFRMEEVNKLVNQFLKESIT